MVHPKRLTSFPRQRVVQRELVRGVASEVDLLEHLGEPTSESSLADDERRFFWDLEWPCGLVTCLEYGQITQQLAVRLDCPEVDHAFRHLGVEVQDLWLLQNEEPEVFAAVAEEPDRSWALWRSDGHGRICVASGLTHRDAHCWQRSLDEREPDAGWSVDEVARFPDVAPLPSRPGVDLRDPSSPRAAQ
ncbi:MAG: hypothetical protein JJU45_03880 [Acidimicrobiia bacterium]|nr:hypothetical protein [Acidimicrobiia bacterium]